MPRDSDKADIIFHSGKVLTVDSGDSVEQAVAIRGESVQAVGSDQDVLGLAGPDTKTVDLQGRTVIPGIIDIHAHMDREGLKRINPSLEGATSIPEILSIIEQQVAQTGPGEWVVIMPVGDPPNYADVPGSLKEGRFPNRWDLDKVSPNNPVYIRGIWTPWNVPPSVAIANSAALQLAGIDRHTQSPDSSVTIEHDDTGEPTGIMVDTGRFPSVEFTLMKVVPRFTHKQRVAALKESMRLYNAVGTTGTYEGHGVAPEVMRVYKEVWDAKEMTVRAHLTLSPGWKTVAQAAQEMERWAHSASGQGFGDSMLHVSGYTLTEKTKIARRHLLDAVAADAGVDALVVILTPQAVTEVSETAAVLSELAPRTGKTLFAVFMGGREVSEAEEILTYILEQKGYRLLETPYALAVDGEVDVVARAETPDGEQVCVLVDVKARARLKELRRWSDRLRDTAFQQRLAETGVTRPFLPYFFGLRVYQIVDDEARRLGIGVLDPDGERVAPTLLR